MACRLEFGNLAPDNARGQVKAVCFLPFTGAADPPTTEIAVRTRDGARLWRGLDEVLKAIAREPCVVGILRKPEASPFARAELDVRALRRATLYLGKEV